MKILSKINYIMTRKQKWQLSGILIIIVIGSFIELIGVSAVLPLINVLMRPEVLTENKYYAYIVSLFQISSTTEFIYYAAIALCFIYVLKSLYLILSKRIVISFAWGIQLSVSTKLMDCYLHQSYLFHVVHNVSELQRNIQSDVAQLYSTISMVLNLLVEGITCILLFVFLLIADTTTTIYISVLLIIFLIIFWFIFKTFQIRYGRVARVAKEKMMRWLLQSFAGIKEIKVLNREKFFLKNYKDSFSEEASAGVNYNMLTMLPKYIIEPLCVCSMLLVMCFRISRGIDISSFVLTLSMFAAAAMRVLPSFNRITEYMSTIMFNKISVDSVFNDLKEIEALHITDEIVKDSEKLPFNEAIKISSVSFSYPNTTKKIFDDASVVIEKNQSVAFIGTSGTGKTTLVDILIGLLQPDEGKIFVDQVDVFQHLNAWHKAIGYIPQMIYLMDDTIRANIVFGLSEEEINDDKIWRALECARLADFVRELEKGLDTRVGDRGIRLSGGQRQRIGIARALYSEPDVLILDEATSSLDNETETAVMESIENLHGKTTLIIIAHRLTTIRNCDVIYEVVNGKIIAKKRDLETEC